jgi:hypothetical protein
MRDWPRSLGFSSTSTRRVASSAEMTEPASATSGLTSLKCQIAGAQTVLGSSGMMSLSTTHSGAMSSLEMR